MRKKLLLLVLVLSLTIINGSFARPVLVKVSGTPITNNLLLHNGSLIEVKVSNTNIGVPVSPEEALNNSKSLVTLSPMFKVNGAGAAFMPYSNILVVCGGVTSRTSMFYDPTQKLFATIRPVYVYNVGTGKQTASYDPPPGSIAVFSVTPNGEIKVIQVLSPAYTGDLGSVVLCPAGIVTLRVGNYPMYTWSEMIYPNGSIVFGSPTTKVLRGSGILSVKSYGYFKRGAPSNIIYPGGISHILLNLTEGYHIPSNPLYDDVYCGYVGDNWVFAVTGSFLRPNHGLVHTPDGHTVNLSTNSYPFTGDILFGNVASPTFLTNVSGNVSAHIFAFYTTYEDLISDADIEVPVGTNGWVMASNEFFNDVCFIHFGQSVFPTTGVPVKMYHTHFGLSAHPIYIAGLSTRDGKYVFLLKSVNSNTYSCPMVLPVVLEVWSSDGTLLKTLNYTLTLPDPDGTAQPRSEAVLTKTGVAEFLPLPGGLIIYNRVTGGLRFVGFNGSYSGRLAAVAPGAKYCVLGNTVYQINYLLNIPAIVYEGNIQIYHNATDVYLGSPIVYKIPSNTGKYGYTMRAISGKIIIGQIYSKKTFVNLITDPTVGTGKLWNMYSRGLITTFRYTNIPGNGTVSAERVVEGYRSGVKSEHVIDYVRYHNLTPWAPYIGLGRVGSAIDIQVPLNKHPPVSSFSSIEFNASLGFGTIVPEYVKNKFIGYTFSEAGVGIGATVIGPMLWNALVRFAPKEVIDQIPSQYGSDLVEYYGVGETANLVLSKAIPIVGCTLIVDSIAGYIFDQNAMHSTMVQTYIMIAPEFHSIGGGKYTVITLLLPKDANIKEWEGYAADILHKEGYNNFVIRVVTLGVTKEQYKDIIAHMSKESLEKTVDLEEGLTELVDKYGLSPSRLYLTKVHVYIATLTSGRVNLWQWITGGLKFQVITTVYSSGFHAQGLIPSRVITSPRIICDLLNPIYVNSVPVNLTPSTNYAIANFVLPAKCQYVVIQVGKPYYAAMTTEIHSQLIAPLYHTRDGLYETNFTYSWKYCFNESRIMFIGMPYKMVDSYETVYTTHGNETVNMTPYMSFITKINDTSSPTGVRYYYGTTTPHDLRLIDPHNAGLMEPGKKYWIQYWYKSPFELGDASISVMFNGTTLASTLPRHARVIINSSKAQTVYGYLDVIVGYEDVKTHQYHTVDSHRFYFALPVGANGTSYREWDIQKYVGEAIHQFSLGRVGYVKLVGVITKAKYDNVKTNDRDSLLYIPPTSLVKPKPVVVTLKVLNSINHSPIPNASVTFDSSHYTTNATGEVSIPTISGYHTVKVSATGYYTKDTGLYAYTNETYYIYLVPSNLAIVLPPVGNNTTPVLPPGAPPLPWNNSTGWTVPPILYNNTTHQYYFPVEVCVQTLDGMAVSGANVSFYNTSTSTLVREDTTDATGYVVEYFPFGYNLTINVTDVAYNFSANRTVLVNRSLIVPFVIPVTSKYYEPEVAVTNVSVWIHMGLGEIPSGTGMAPVYHSVDCWFYTNKPQTITFKVWFVDLKTNKTIASKTFTAKLHMGYQKVRVFVPVNVSDFTTCQVFCEITKYEYDTNPYNNMAAGNAVTFRPWVDIYPTIVWYPIKQKTPYGLLPGDTIKVCIGVHVPKGVHLPNILVKYSVESNKIGKHSMKTILSRKTMFTSVGSVTTVWYNYSVQLPWTNEVVLNVSVYDAYDLAPENNNFSVTIPLSPDAQCVAASIQSIEVSSGEFVPLRVTVRSNYVNVSGVITVIDETAKNTTLAIYDYNQTSPEETFVIKVKAPTVPKIYETHTWLVYVNEMNDVYLKDNTQEITVTIWGLPSWIVLTAIFVVVLIILLLIKHLLTIRPPREGKYFRKLDEKPPSGGLTIGGTKEGKYFRRIK